MAPMADVHPFRIDVPDDVLVDLRRRLAATRWPEAESVDDWSQGIPLEYARDLATYWANGYDWRHREAALNRFDQFTTEIDGLNFHFVHQRSPHADAFPLVLTHGWPGSIVEFHKVIGPLTDPTAHGGRAEDAFHVVCPSLPGYGFSAKPSATGWNIGEDRQGVGDPDGSPRLRALRRPGRRLGRPRSPPTSVATSGTASRFTPTCRWEGLPPAPWTIPRMRRRPHSTR